MAIIAVGPEFAIDGPLPVAPKYTLVGATLVADEGGDERWANGILVHGYPQEVGTSWGVCSASGGNPLKDSQEFPIPLPAFGPITVYLTETCSTPYIKTPEDFRARALAVFAAVESGAIEREFWTGAEVPGNPHLADADADVLLGGAATTIVDGLARLEDEIAATHRRGVIHMTAGLAVAITALGGGGILQDVGGKLYTINGTLVIPGAGYTGDAPAGAAANTGSEEFAFATGPVETLRTSQPVIIPETIQEAVNRLTNTVEYRAERYYIPFWDTALQVGIRIDRCLAECG